MVLAAGFGTRLRPLTDLLPKAAVAIANRPLIAYALDAVAGYGIRDAVVNAHHLPALLEEALPGATPVGMRVRVLREPEILGTGGGVRNTARDLWGSGEDVAVVLNADTIYAPDLAAALRVHQAHGALATMVVREVAEPERFGAVYVDDSGRVRSILTPPPAGAPRCAAYMFAGVHLLSEGVARALPAQGCIIRRGYLEWLAAGEVVAACVDTQPWLEVGTPRAYLHANMALATGKFAWPGLQPHPDGVLVAAGAQVDPAARLIRSVVGPGARVGPGAVLTDCVVWAGAEVLRSVSSSIVTPGGVLPV